MELTIATVELNGIGRKLDGDSPLGGLWEFEILYLTVCAEHVDIQDCRRWS